MVCHPVPLITHGGFGRITCAVPSHQGSNGAIIYGTEAGVYRGSSNGAPQQLLSIRDVRKIQILPESNLFLCVAGSNLLTLSLSVVDSGAARESEITRISKRVSCFAVYRSNVPGENPRVCVVQSGTLSGSTIKIFDVSGNNQASVVVPARELYSPFDYHSVRFLGGDRIAAAVQKSITVQGGFLMADLVTMDRLYLQDDGPATLELALQESRPITMFRKWHIILMTEAIRCE
ncbi:hypothetical protein DFH06DRAFT_1224409, partial [Mycena polygramma]